MGPPDRNGSIAIVGAAIRRMSAEGERNHPDTGGGDHEQETVSKEAMKYKHDRIPLSDQPIDCATLTHPANQ
jgi:hypothetical protein